MFSFVSSTGQSLLRKRLEWPEQTVTSQCVRGLGVWSDNGHVLHAVAATLLGSALRLLHPHALLGLVACAP